jgi:circadian clock protein KaiC
MDKIRTYQEGLDEILGGGIPSGHVVLLVGAPGTMKSSLSYAIIHENASRGVPGIYVSLEQHASSLRYQMTRLGYDEEASAEHLSVLDLAALRNKVKESETPWIDFFKMYASGLMKKSGFRFLVLDSLDALEILAHTKNHRKDVFELFSWLRELECTSFVIGELASPNSDAATLDHPGFSRHREDYLADGIIHLKLEKQGEFGMQRRLRIVKMRGTNHSTSYHAIVFDKGFKVTQVVS